MRHNNRRGLAASMIAAVVILLTCGPVLQAQVKTLPEKDSGGGGPRPVPLINADEDMAHYVRKAQELAEQKDYAAAIEILQALLTRQEQCFVSGGDAERRRYVSLAARATEVIGALPKDGPDLYRRLYDPQADRLLQTAAETFDEAALRDIVRRYFHTRHGDRALNLLGTILFDRGQFSQAARCWGDVVERYSDTKLDKAVLLSKTAVAHQFAGEDRQAGEVVARLRKDYSKTDAVLAGANTNVVAFTEQMLKMTPPDFATGRVMLEGWFSLAGAPDSVAVMSPCRPVLSPRWTQPQGRIEDNLNLRSMFPPSPQNQRVIINGRVQMAQSASMDLRDGHVFGVRMVNNKPDRAILPALIHPVVVGSTVIVREADAVRAYDLLTGDKVWDTFDDYPLFRRVTQVGQAQYYGGYGSGFQYEDEGRCTLTVGGGKVFAVGNFPPPMAQQRFINPRTGASQIPDTSELRALSLTGEGKQVWRTDEPGQPDFLRAAKFLCAPTYSAGKVYATVEYTQAYYVVCLNADTGRLLWKAMVSQAPVTSNPYGQAMSQGESGSAPAVADGRVFVTTNAGVVAAFEADTGRGIWAYQYDSWRNQPVDPSNRMISYQKMQSQKTYPPNPVVVARGRVLCLPADSEAMLALHADTGEPVWPPQDRHNQRFLAAIDDGRVVLAGPNLMVADLRTGKGVWPSPQITDVEGRPAVTPEAVLVSGKGRVFRVSLPDYTVTDTPLVDIKAYLGNLVCAQGKLVAANTAGLSAYVTFEDAHRELSDRLAKAAEKDTPILLYQRGMNAFNAAKPDLALPDLLAARTQAQAVGDSSVLSRTEQGLYRAYVALANRAGSTPQAMELLKKAEGFAYSDRSRAELLVRLAKYHEAVGQHATAASLAHKLTTAYARTDLADVAFGPSADRFVQDSPDTPRLEGYALGHQLIKGLTERHGQACYAEFDAKAKAEMDLAAGAKDPDGMVRVADTYKYSAFAPLALLKAAELHYADAVAAAQKDAVGGHLSDAGVLLSRIMMDYPQHEMAASASLGLAMVYERMRPNIAWFGLQGLSQASPDAHVGFAGVSGTLKEVLTRLDWADRKARPEPQPLSFVLRPPLTKLYDAADNAVVLRDGEGRPVRLGEKFVVLRGNTLVLFDPQAAGPSEADAKVSASLEKSLDLNRMWQYGIASWQYGQLAGMTADQKVFVFGCRGGFVGVDTDSWKVRWSRGVSDPIVSQLMGMAMSDDLLIVQTTSGRDGSVVAVDMKDGKTVWEHKLPQSAFPWRQPPQVGGGILVTVHGQNQWTSSVFDLKTKKLLGTAELGNNTGQAVVTADGLVLLNDGSAIRLVEPILGMDRPIWKVAMPKAMQPAILSTTSTRMVVSPDASSGLIEVRSLVHYGRIERTLETENVAGQAAVPVSADLRGDRLYVMTTIQAGNIQQNRLANRVTYSMMPSLQVFDVTTGKLLWKLQCEAPGSPQCFVMPPEVGASHVTLLIKPTSWNMESTAYVLEAETGKTVQKISLPGIQPAAGAAMQQRYTRFQWLASPVMASGRVVVETNSGLAVHGSSPQVKP